MSDTHPAATQSEVPPIQRQPGIWCGAYCVCVCVCPPVGAGVGTC
jgi:hypothetical protein